MSTGLVLIVGYPVAGCKEGAYCSVVIFYVLIDQEWLANKKKIVFKGVR